MANNWIFGPILIIILQIFTLLFIAAFKRIKAVRSGKLDYTVIQNLNHHLIPQDILLPGRCYDNQFQQPMLFIILLSLLAANDVSTFYWIIFSWLYTMLRCWHMFEHVSARNIKRRTYAFALSSTIHFFMWLIFILFKFFNE